MVTCRVAYCCESLQSCVLEGFFFTTGRSCTLPGTHSGYGPGDQGAYNSFYRDTVNFLDEKYNAKLYKKYRADALIVHFHGPKPHQYMEQLMEGECSFSTLPSLCKDGLGGFCTYLVDDHYFGNIPALQKTAEAHCEKWWTKKKRTLWGHIRG